MRQFPELGYAITPQVLSENECNQLLRELSSWETGRSRAGVRHLMSCPAVSSVARDQRLQVLALEALGELPTPYRATLFEKSGDSNWLVAWHQDTALPLTTQFMSPEWGPWSHKSGITYAHAPAWALERIVTLRIHLDPCGQDNGPLRVLPGTHRKGILTNSEISILAKDEPFTECLVPQGGILVMKPLVLHASSRARKDAPRRVVHIEYAPASGLPEKIQLAVA